MMISVEVFVFVVLLGVAVAYIPGQYVPRSFYVIDRFGHQSEPVYIRNKREIMDNPLLRVRRGGGYASASSHASASAGSSSNGGGSGSGGGGGGPVYFGDYVPNFASDPEGIFRQIQDLLNNIPGPGAAGAGAHSFASSSSSASSGNGAGAGQGFGGLGSGQDAGYHGPVLFSRFGETEGSGVHVSGQAQGNRGAFSSSSSSIDDQGKIKYSVKSGKY